MKSLSKHIQEIFNNESSKEVFLLHKAYIYKHCANVSNFAPICIYNLNVQLIKFHILKLNFLHVIYREERIKTILRNNFKKSGDF